MSQDLTVNLKTTSDVPQAVERAKNAVKSFNAQVEGIGNKFGNSFQSIFLSFLGPMALVGMAMSFIGKFISDNQKRHEDATQSAIDGTNKLMSTEDRYWANRRNNESTSFKNVQEANLVRIQTTEQFLREDPRGNKMVDDYVKNMPKGLFESNSPYAALKRMSLSKATQDEIQDILAEDMKNNPGAGVNAADATKAQTAAQKTNDDAAKAKGTTFKGPEGFSNVVGVGANPVMEAMTMQLEETRKQTALLEILARPAGGGVPVDYTKSTSSTPSRAAMLSGK